MIPDLLSACKSARLAVLTGSRDPEIHRKAMLLGAIGIISTDDPPGLLLNAVKRVNGGGVWIDRHVTARMLANLSIPGELSPDEEKIATLTERERQVIKLVALGLKNRRIGEQLFISEVTVHHHLTSIYSKLELTGRLELIVYAYRHRLADLPR
jgi:DNA-binding NarL/FixJ family response regulator